MDYQKGKIYKISSSKGDMIYIGSTVKKFLCERMAMHRHRYKEWKLGNYKNNFTSFRLFDDYGVENCSIILLESCPCNSKDELHAREAFYIKSMDCVNKVIPNRSKKEYYEDNKESINKKKCQYRKENSESLKESASQKIVCECGRSVSRRHIARHKTTPVHIELMTHVQ